MKMSYVIEKELWLKSEVAQIRRLTYAIDATTDRERVPQNLKDIEAIARRARERLVDLGIKDK